jgi:hypothetical protein
MMVETKGRRKVQSWRQKSMDSSGDMGEKYHERRRVSGGEATISIDESVRRELVPRFLDLRTRWGSNACSSDEGKIWGE